MSDPSWKQLAQIPETLEKKAVLHALAIDPPPEGVSDYLVLHGNRKLQAAEGGLILTECNASFYITPRDAPKIVRVKKGTPTGELLHWWLRVKGYLPKAPESADPTPQT